MKKKEAEDKEKKPLYRRWWLWAAAAVAVSGIVSGGEKEKVKIKEEQVIGAEEATKSCKELPDGARVICRALTMSFVKNVLQEKYSMSAFKIESFEFDENNNGTIYILYMPNNAGSGTAKINLQIKKVSNVYTIEYALIDGIYEVDMKTVLNEHKTAEE